MFEHQQHCPSGVRTPNGRPFWCSNRKRTVLLVNTKRTVLRVVEYQKRTVFKRTVLLVVEHQKRMVLVVIEHHKDGLSSVRKPKGRSFWCSNVRTPKGRSIWWSNTKKGMSFNDGPSGVRTLKGRSFWCSNTQRAVLLVFEH